MSKKKTRANFRNSVYKRDAYTCKICGYKPPKDRYLEELDAHHITDRNEMPNGGYVKENGISLCCVGNNCHLKAEKYHQTNGTEWIEGMHPDDLYALVNSTKGLAVLKSNELAAS